MLTTDSYYSTPNLDALMAEFGLSRTPGLVVEGDSGHSLSGYPYYLLPDYADRHRERHTGRHRHQPPRPAADGAGHHHHRDGGRHLGSPAGQLPRAPTARRRAMR